MKSLLPRRFFQAAILFALLVLICAPNAQAQSNQRVAADGTWTTAPADDASAGESSLPSSSKVPDRVVVHLNPPEGSDLGGYSLEFLFVGNKILVGENNHVGNISQEDKNHFYENVVGLNKIDGVVEIVVDESGDQIFVTSEHPSDHAFIKQFVRLMGEELAQTRRANGEKNEGGNRP